MAEEYKFDKEGFEKYFSAQNTNLFEAENRAIDEKEAYLETRHPAAGFDDIPRVLDDPSMKTILFEYLDKQDTYDLEEAPEFFNLAASIKVVDPERYIDFYEDKQENRATLFNNLLSKIINRPVGPEKLLVNVYKLKVLFPDSIGTDFFLSIQQWDDIAEAINAFRKNGNWQDFAKSYNYATQLDPREIMERVKIEESDMRSLSKNFSSLNATPVKQAQMSAWIDALNPPNKENTCLISQQSWQKCKDALLMSLAKADSEKDSEKKFKALRIAFSEIAEVKFAQVARK